jgi:hypothetical protein
MTGLLAALIWACLGFAAGQAPLTPAVGQYCSQYYTGFTSTLGGKLDVHTAMWTYDCATSSCSKAVTCDCAYMGVCQGQATPACPWAVGSNCGVESPCNYCSSENCATCDGIEGFTFCNPGCGAVASCTAIPNAYFTGPANPSTSRTGCPYACNNGYILSGANCVPGPTTAACPASTYNNGTACAPCPTCYNGYYRAGCTGSSPGTCESCTNVNWPAT